MQTQPNTTKPATPSYKCRACAKTFKIKRNAHSHQVQAHGYRVGLDVRYPSQTA